MRIAAFFAILFSLGSIAFGLNDKMSGPGFFTTVQVQAPTLTLKGVDAFVDGTDVFFVLGYTSARAYDTSFFDPPDRKYLSLSAPKAIQAGDGTLVFQVPLARMAKVTGVTVMIDPRVSGQFVYFAINEGVSGLARKEAPDDIRKNAIVYKEPK